MKLRVIPTNVHGAIDHAIAPTLIAAPAIFGLRDGSPEGLVARVVGSVETVYANLTDYEMSLKNVIPMRAHLALDAVGGAALATIPHVTGARKRGLLHWLPHTAIGAFEVALALLTKPEPPKTMPQRAGKVAGLLRKLKP
ncbi:MAG TPA: hypothetical protein VFJ91_06455 [Gaiellaceae bacterium]|nr:hypothetical protein [Gaiellaceae bacterium]